MDTTERLLGQLVSQVQALQRGLDNNHADTRREFERRDREFSEAMARKDQELKLIQEELRVLNGYVNEAKGGKRLLAALLAAASVFGGLFWEILQRIGHLGK